MVKITAPPSHTALSDVRPGNHIGDNAYIISANVFHGNDTQRTTTVQTYTKLKETKLNKWLSGMATLRIAFSLNGQAGEAVNGKIYRNGSPVGTERQTTSTTPVEFTEDISGWAENDLIQIYGRAAATGYCAISNSRILGHLRLEQQNISGY